MILEFSDMWRSALFLSCLLGLTLFVAPVVVSAGSTNTPVNILYFQQKKESKAVIESMVQAQAKEYLPRMTEEITKKLTDKLYAQVSEKMTLEEVKEVAVPMAQVQAKTVAVMVAREHVKEWLAGQLSLGADVATFNDHKHRAQMSYLILDGGPVSLYRVTDPALLKKYDYFDKDVDSGKVSVYSSTGQRPEGSNTSVCAPWSGECSWPGKERQVLELPPGLYVLSQGGEYKTFYTVRLQAGKFLFYVGGQFVSDSRMVMRLGPDVKTITVYGSPGKRKSVLPVEAFFTGKTEGTSDRFLSPFSAREVHAFPNKDKLGIKMSYNPAYGEGSLITYIDPAMRGWTSGLRGGDRIVGIKGRPEQTPKTWHKYLVPGTTLRVRKGGMGRVKEVLLK